MKTLHWNPWAQAAAAYEIAWLAVETQTVIGMRLMGMAGAWNVTKGENARMVSEKLPAWGEAIAAGGAKALGGRPDLVLPAMVAPLRRKTKANARRLAKRGVRVGR
ncbi:MAG: antifreeze protein [Shimia sp.]